MSFTARLALLVVVSLGAACAATPPPGEQHPPQPRAASQPEDHHHETNLPPVGPQVSVGFEGKQSAVSLASVPHEGASASLVEVWKLAFPSEDAAPLHFDLVGSDGFRPASRPACPRLLNGTEIAALRIDIASHDVSFDDSAKLPKCYHVRALVRLEATR
jgi:hypothetical protein